MFMLFDVNLPSADGLEEQSGNIGMFVYYYENTTYIRIVSGTNIYYLKVLGIENHNITDVRIISGMSAFITYRC